jgi:hypothetical protein
MNKRQFRAAFASLPPQTQRLLIKTMEELLKDSGKALPRRRLTNG